MHTAWALWDVYHQERLLRKLHAVGRALACPFNRVLPHLDVGGELLEVGCGYGILWQLAMLRNGVAADRRLVGIDHAIDKIQVARRAARPMMEFSNAALETLAAARFDAVVLVDVLCCIRLDRWPAILGECRRVMKPGGRLIVKEVVNRPRWRYWLTLLEEILAARVFRFTRGDWPHFESAEAYRNAVESAGFQVIESFPCRTWHPASQHLWVVVKPERAAHDNVR